MTLPPNTESAKSTTALRKIGSGPFLVSSALLVIAAILAGPVADWLQIKQNKAGLPLVASLSALDEGALGPYRVARRDTLEPMIVDALGTDQYLSWVVEDTSVAESHPLRHAQLLVTYYSGGHNLVPHTPDICFMGAGYEPAQRHENLEVEVPALGSGASPVPIRVCTFARTKVFDSRNVSVVYTFSCNGRFVATRNGVRILANTPSNTYAYFSKVEVSFPRATRAESVEGARKLFNRVLPVLVKEHWPNFEEAERLAQTQ